MDSWILPLFSFLWGGRGKIYIHTIVWDVKYYLLGRRKFVGEKYTYLRTLAIAWTVEYHLLGGMDRRATLPSGRQTLNAPCTCDWWSLYSERLSADLGVEWEGKEDPTSWSQKLPKIYRIFLQRYTGVIALFLSFTEKCKESRIFDQNPRSVTIFSNFWP